MPFKMLILLAMVGGAAFMLSLDAPNALLSHIFLSIFGISFVSFLIGIVAHSFL